MAFLTLESGPKVYYEIAGDGEPLVQIGGGTLAHHNYDWLTPHLTSRQRVITFDLPGYGESDWIDSHSLTGMAEYTAQVLRALDCSHVSLSGISTGGIVALITAVTYPELVRRVICGGVMLKPDRLAQLMRLSWQEAARAQGMSAVAHLTIASGYSRQFLEQDDADDVITWMHAAFAKRSAEHYLAAASALHASLDLVAVAANVRVPMLLMGGSEDQISPLRAGKSGVGLADFHMMTRGSTLSVIDGSGHCYYAEQPRLSARRILEFLEDHA